MGKLSESFYITAGSLGIGGLALVMWYFKSILLTSRCEHIDCCCLHIRNKILSEQALQEVITHEQPPPVPSIPGNPRSTLNGAI